jgi:solute:Na+ symporter, SSS family
VLVGLTTSYLVNRYAGPGTGAWLIGSDAFNKREADDWGQLAGIFANLTTGSLWFVGTTLFASSRSTREVERVDHFFKKMHAPVDFDREEGAQGGGSDRMQAGVMGMLCLIYGAFIALLALLPNPWSGRVAFLFCGGVMLVIGWLLRRTSHAPAAQIEPNESLGATEHGASSQLTDGG